MKSLFASLISTLLFSLPLLNAHESLNENRENPQKFIVRQQPWCASPSNACEELEFIEEEAPCNSWGHAAISAGYVSVSPADFKTSAIENDDIAYREGFVSLAFTYDLSPLYGMSFGLGYVNSNVDWDENPFFDQKEFGYVSALFGGFWKCPECWYWKATIGANFDTQQFNLASYTLYQGMLWGRYSVCDPLGINFGFLAEVGLNKEKVWPIFGIDYVINPSWKLNIIYPIDVSLEYLFHPKWATGISARFLRSRHRVSEDQPLPKAIYEYRTTGVEWDLIFKPFPWLSAEGFVGYTGGGDFKITNRYNHHADHFKFDPSFYSGINLIAEF